MRLLISLSRAEWRLILQKKIFKVNFYLCICLYVGGYPQRLERVEHPLELELQETMSYLEWALGTKFGSTEKKSECPSLLRHLPSLQKKIC